MSLGTEEKTVVNRKPAKTELKCRPCGKILPASAFTYSQKKKKYRRRCVPCVAYALYLRGDGPYPADPSACDAKIDDGHIVLTSQLLPPQKLSGVSHLKTIVVEPSGSGRGQRRARTEMRKGASQIRRAKPTKGAKPTQEQVVVEKDYVEESPSSSSPVKTSGGKKVLTSPGFDTKPGHNRQPSASDEARALYMRQLKGRRKIRASRDFDAEAEETPELLTGEKGRKRLSVLESGYLRESMKPGPERVIGGN